MKIASNQDWKLVHIMALALIMMFASFALLILVQLPVYFTENILYYLALVPYILVIFPFTELEEGDPHGLPIFDDMYLGLYFVFVYILFFALASLLVGKKKIISAAYITLCVMLAIIFDRLFWLYF